MLVRYSLGSSGGDPGLRPETGVRDCQHRGEVGALRRDRQAPRAGETWAGARAPRPGSDDRGTRGRCVGGGVQVESSGWIRKDYGERGVGVHGRGKAAGEAIVVRSGAAEGSGPLAAGRGPRGVQRAGLGGRGPRGVQRTGLGFGVPAGCSAQGWGVGVPRGAAGRACAGLGGGGPHGGARPDPWRRAGEAGLPAWYEGVWCPPPGSS